MTTSLAVADEPWVMGVTSGKKDSSAGCSGDLVTGALLTTKIYHQREHELPEMESVFFLMTEKNWLTRKISKI